MLRLCHELNRFSVDLDFWFIKKIPQEKYFDTIQKAFEKDYEITDSGIRGEKEWNVGILEGRKKL